MKKLLVAGLAASALAMSTPGAYASHAYAHAGGCGFAAVSDAVAGEGQMTGAIDVAAVVYSTEPTELPVSATFTCYILVNGAPQPGAVVSASGTVLVAGGGVVTYTSDSVDDVVQLCQTIAYSGPGGSATVSECIEATTFEVPPPLLWEVVDPAVCPALQTVGGLLRMVPPDIAIGEDGDVYVDGFRVYNCPPY